MNQIPISFSSPRRPAAKLHRLSQQFIAHRLGELVVAVAVAIPVAISVAVAISVLLGLAEGFGEGGGGQRAGVRGRRSEVRGQEGLTPASCLLPRACTVLREGDSPIFVALRITKIGTVPLTPGIRGLDSVPVACAEGGKRNGAGFRFAGNHGRLSAIRLQILRPVEQCDQELLT